MNLNFDKSLANDYTKNPQKIRVMSEQWVAKNIFCPNCGNPHISTLGNNKPVADYQCDCCGEIYELKSKKGRLGKNIVDGAYSTMIERITSTSNPNLFVLSYSLDLQVIDLLIIPKFFFVPNIIKKRKPLSSTARRAGWVGCNILLGDIPEQGIIKIISKSNVLDKNNVVNLYKHIKTLQTNNLETRGWLMDVLNCINDIPSAEFCLSDIYKFKDELQKKHIENHNVKAKIRQQLQLLRDKKFIEFVARGHYRKII